MKNTLCILFLLVGLISPSHNEARNRGETRIEGNEVTEGFVRLRLVKSHSAARMGLGLAIDEWQKNDSIVVNGEKYPIAQESDGKWYADVKAAEGEIYRAVYASSDKIPYYNSNDLDKVMMPYSQFWSSTTKSMSGLPMFACRHKGEDPILTFSDGYALIDIALKGNGERIKSVKIEHRTGDSLAGLCNYDYEKQALVATAGVPYIALNCTRQGGVLLSDEPTHFYIPLLATDYPDGLYLRISDTDHKMMDLVLDEKNLKANQCLAVSMTYEPDSDLIFFEGFDNCVWGGDYVAGQLNGKRFSPSATDPGVTAEASLTGYEESLTNVKYDMPGTGFLQSNTWSDVSGKDVYSSHAMSDSYIASRDLGRYKYLFRTQEFSGYLGVGAATPYRGVFMTDSWNDIEGLKNITIDFDVAFMAGFNDNLEVRICQSGIIESVSIDETEIELTEQNHKYAVTTSSFIALNNLFRVSNLAQAPKTWHHIRMVVSQATDNTCLNLQSQNTVAWKHGFYVDNLEVRLVSKDEERGDLRVLYWNIQNGMWSDQGNNYDNFVAWVKKYDPDICVWCEAGSIWKTNSDQALDAEDCYLPNKGSSTDTNEGWKELARRYGHPYARLGGHRDNYPQEITSRYPITTLMKITDTSNNGKPISHGAALQEVNVEGRKLHFITMHTWPQDHRYGVSAEEKEASAAAREGDYYREYEMDYVLKKTYLSKAFRTLGNWLLLGDLNSISIADNFYYNMPADTSLFRCQNVVRNTDLVDIVEYTYPKWFMTSTKSGARIDFIYVSPDLAPYIKKVYVLKDKWAEIAPDVSTPFCNPSDHRPIMVDFDFDKSTDLSPRISKGKKRIEKARYDASGRRISKKAKGISVVKYEDGSALKLLNR